MAQTQNIQVDVLNNIDIMRTIVICMHETNSRWCALRKYHMQTHMPHAHKNGRCKIDVFLFPFPLVSHMVLYFKQHVCKWNFTVILRSRLLC